jgi:hypothetical protein
MAARVSRPPGRRHRILAVCLILALTAVACGDDGGSDPSTTEGDPDVTSDDGGPTSTVDVVVPQTDPALAGVYLEGEPVAVGAVAEMGPLIVTVEDIGADTGNGSLSVQMRTENPSADAQSGPDVYSVCTEDGRFALASADSEIQSLETLDPGSTSAGVAEIEVPQDCGDLVVQVRVLAVTPGGDHIAQYPVTD